MGRPSLLDSPRLVTAIAWVSLIIGALPLVSGLLSALSDREWAQAGALFFLFVALGGILWRFASQHFPAPPEPTDTFGPFRQLDSATAWPRPDDAKRVAAALLRQRRTTIPVVVGASGVGKTTLLTLLLPDELEQRSPAVHYKVVHSYATLRSTLSSLIESRAPGTRLIIVLDQFEQWLAQLRLLPPQERAEERAWITQVFTDAQRSQSYSLGISLRKEWYYDLRFLGSLAPAPNQVCNIEGPSISNAADEMGISILTAFQQVVGNHTIAQGLIARLGTTGRISPLQAQMVGAVIERHIRRGEAFNLNTFDSAIGGVQGAIERFFGDVIQGARSPEICLKVLCGLSTRTRFRRQVAFHSLLAGLFEDPTRVREEVKYLREQGLVLERGPGTLDLAHDYLAEFFNSKSGVDLNPIERDNIFVLAEADGQINTEAVYESVPAGRFRLGRAVATLIFTAMVARLLYFNVDWTIAGPDLYQPVFSNLLDASYIPIFVAHTAWLFYIAAFYDRVFIRLHESKAQQILSIVVVVNLVICIGAAIVYPFSWLVAIAFGGFVLALKLVSLARRRDLNRTARDRLMVFGSVTLFNLIFIALLGAASLAVSIETVSSSDDSGPWLAATTALAIMMTYAAIALAPVHVSRSGVSQILGLMGRPTRMAVLPSDPI